MIASNRSLGIDLKDNKLRLVYLSSSNKKIKLLNYACLPLPQLDEGNLSVYEDAFVESLRNFISKNRIKAKQVIIGLPQKDVIFRKIEIPAVKNEELKQILGFEILKHVPFVNGEIGFDFQIVRRKEPNKLEVVLVAAKKELINYRLSLFKTAGIDYSRLELSTFALFAGLSRQGTNKVNNYVIVDVGLEEIEFALIQDGKLVFSHSASQNTLPIARFIKTENNSDELEKIKELMGAEGGQLADKLCEEVRVLLTSWRQNEKEFNAQQLFLCGTGVTTLLADYLQAYTGIETSIWNPWQGISGNTNNLPLEGATAVGLALEGFHEIPHGVNLLPLEEQTHKEEDSFVIPIILGVVLTLLLLASGASYMIKERRESERINQQIADLKPKLAEVEKLDGQYRMLQTQMQNLKKSSHQPASVLKVLKELTLKLPSDVWLDNFKMTKKDVEISGYAGAAYSLVPVLEASDLFKNVQSTSTITTEGVSAGKEKFKLKMALENVEDLGPEEKNGAAR